MVKKIKAIAAIAIILVIAAASASIAVINSKTVKDVNDVVMAACTENSITVEWKKVSGADGYHIYTRKSTDDKFENACNIEDGDVLSYKLCDMKSGEEYLIKVTAFKIFRSREYESENAQEIKAYAMPAKPDVKLASEFEGVFEAQWNEQNNAAGYDVEYGKDENLKESQKESISDVSFELEGLTPNDIYYFRARSYIIFENEKVYSEWSDIQSVEIKEKFVMPKDIDPSKPIVALSFDDGPGFVDKDGICTTSQILDILEDYGARATFFMCASRLNDENKNVLQREIALGCELGNHTYNHKNYGKDVTANDIKSCSEKIYELSGQYPKAFRCPGGIMTKRIKDECKREGMFISYWSIDTEDWKSQDADKVYDAVMSRVFDGSIILMHDIYPSTVDAVKKIVPKLIEEGYQVVSVGEMLTIKNDGKKPTPGEQYVDYKTINNNT